MHCGPLTEVEPVRNAGHVIARLTLHNHECGRFTYFHDMLCTDLISSFRFSRILCLGLVLLGCDH
jgi:hypothetical protein